jgi:hypothetical protein
MIEVEIDTQAISSKPRHKVGVKMQARVALVEVTDELHASAVITGQRSKPLGILIELIQYVPDVRLQRLVAR